MDYTPTPVSALWDVALECAARREFRDCNVELHNTRCQDCKYYVCRYAPESNMLDLLMVKAESEACGLKLADKNITLAKVFTVIPFILIILGMLKTCI